MEMTTPSKLASLPVPRATVFCTRPPLPASTLTCVIFSSHPVWVRIRSVTRVPTASRPRVSTPAQVAHERRPAKRRDVGERQGLPGRAGQRQRGRLGCLRQHGGCEGGGEYSTKDDSDHGRAPFDDGPRRVLSCHPSDGGSEGLKRVASNFLRAGNGRGCHVVVMSCRHAVEPGAEAPDPAGRLAQPPGVVLHRRTSRRDRMRCAHDRQRANGRAAFRRRRDQPPADADPSYFTFRAAHPTPSFVLRGLGATLGFHDGRLSSLDGSVAISGCGSARRTPRSERRRRP